MKQGTDTIRARRNARWLVAAAFLMIMCIEVSSHAAELASFRSGSSTVICDITHHGLPSADCPHKKNPFGPQKAFFDEMTHHWLMLADLSVPVKGTVYSTDPSFVRDDRAVSTPLEPPFHPPRTALN